jgi:hypothetical protein
MVELERLPISGSLRGRIREWAGQWEDVAWRAIGYDDVVNGMRSGPAVPVSEVTHDEVDREGGLLCEELRVELGADWRVAYATFPDGRYLQWEIGGPMQPG